MSAKKEEHYQEPEERLNSAEPIDTEIPTEEFDPMDEEKKQRAQSQSGVGQGSSQPMPEYNVKPDNTGGAPDANGEADGGGKPGNAEEEEIEDYEELKKKQEAMTPQQIQDDARMTAEVGLDLLGWGLQELGNATMPVKIKTQKKIYKEGVDPNMPINLGDAKIPVQQAFDIHNDSCTAAIETFPFPQKVKDKVIPIIANELAKRGLVMSPILYAAGLLGKHLVKVSGAILEGVKLKGDLITAIRETGEHYKNSRYAPQHTTHQAQVPIAETPAEEMPVQEPIQEMATPEVRVKSQFDAIQKTNRAGRGTGKGRRGTYRKKKKILVD